MKYKIQDIVDLKQLQLLTETLYKAQGLPSAIISTEGEILAGAGWQKICTEFHRNHPQTIKDCLKSDCRLNEKIEKGAKFVIYECPRGLVDSAAPIFINGEHIASVFTGQFLTSKPTIETEQFFRDQAKEFGFDEEKYIDAFREIPIFSNDRHRLLLNVLVQFSELISQLANTRISEIEKMQEIIENENKTKQILNTLIDGFVIVDKYGDILEVNKTISDILGYSHEELLTLNISKIDSLLNEEEKKQLIENVQSKGSEHFETKMLKKDKTKVDVEVNISSISSKEKYFVLIRDITGRKLAEQKLVESEKKFRKIIEEVPEIAIQGYDEQRRVTFWNEASEKLYGYTKEETIGVRLEDLIIPEEMIDGVIHLHSRWIKYGEKIPAGELNLKHKDGYKVPVFSSHLIHDSLNGKEMFCLDIDLDPIKQAENELQKSQQRATALLQAIPDMMFRLDKYGTFIDYQADKNDLYANKGITIIGKRNRDLTPPEFADMIDEKIQQTLLMNNMQTFEYQLDMTDGIRNYEARMVKSGEEEVTAIVRDITEKKQAENKQKDNEERYQRLADASFEAIFFSENGICINQNKTAEKLFGYTLEEAIGKPGTDWIHPDSRDLVRKHIISGNEEPYEAVAIRKNGSEFACEIQARETTYHNRPIRITALRDISDRKNAEKAVIENRRLGTLGEMSSAVAHDFNNLLQSIFGNLELALFDNNISSKTRNHLETIKTAASDAATRIQVLQRFGGNKKSRGTFKLINLNEIVKDVIIQLRPLWKDQVEKYGIEISIKPEYKEIPKIKGDEGELRSVLYNIIKNSIEAMPKGGEICIKTGGNSKNVMLSVSDNGIGMDSETQNRIFQPFFTTKGFESGRGLGMSGAYGIIKDHNGRLFVKESIQGIGTTIEINIPSTDEKEEISSNSQNVKNTSSIKVLWVDDEKMIRDVVVDQLELLGHDGEVVSSGQEALDRLDENIYDMVITDIGMPGMNGWQLADIIKNKFSGKLKVAVLSGWGAQIDEKTKTDHNVEYVLSKPYRLQNLQKLINDMMG